MAYKLLKEDESPLFLIILQFSKKDIDILYKA